MTELLLELYSEEIPASMQAQASRELSDILQNLCQRYEINYTKFLSFSGLCRITLVGKGLAKNIPASESKIKGPAVNVDSQIVEAFCRTHQITISDLVIEAIKDKPYYFYYKQIPAKPTKEILAEIIPIAIKEYSWPKSMQWGDHDISWIRPLRNILCLLDNQVLIFTYGHLTSNNITYGHKFLSNQALPVHSLEDYYQLLSKHQVILNRIARKELILAQLQSLQQAHPNLDFGLRATTEQPNFFSKNNQELLEELLGLSEYPQVLMGKIPQEFVTLPEEVLTTVMRKHQRYLSVLDTSGKLAPYFIFVANIKVKDPQSIIQGNQRVLNARLADAQYFYQHDLRTALSSLLSSLHTLIFHQKLGSMHDKVERLVKISTMFPKHPKLQQAAQLCKADLASAMVLELPELQGIMGKYYAIHLGFDSEIAEAIAQHYCLPKDTTLSPLAILLTLVDRLDSLVGLFMAGEIATGSKDPYGLRRHAIAIINLLEAGNLQLELKAIIEEIAKLYQASYPTLPWNDSTLKVILNFIEDRTRYALRKELNSSEWPLIEVVLNLTAESNLTMTLAKLKALRGFIATEAGQRFLNTYNRIANILAANLEQNIPENLAPELFSQYEVQVYQVLQAVVERYHNERQSLNYSGAYHALANLNQPIDELFDNVLIKSEDHKLMLNRLALMRHIITQLQGFGNFKQLY